MGTHYNRLPDDFVISTHTIHFNGEIWKIIHNYRQIPSLSISLLSGVNFPWGLAAAEAESVPDSHLCHDRWATVNITYYPTRLLVRHTHIYTR